MNDAASRKGSSSATPWRRRSLDGDRSSGGGGDDGDGQRERPGPAYPMVDAVDLNSRFARDAGAGRLADAGSLLANRT